MTSARIFQGGGLSRKRRSALTGFIEAVITMELVSRQILVSAQTDGRGMTVAFQFVSNSACIMEIALILTRALVKEVGLDMIVALLCVLRCVRMEVIVLLLIPANACNGKMGGEMTLLEAAFHYFKSQMEILN
jgi:hypothetical protein